MGIQRPVNSGELGLGSFFNQVQLIEKIYEKLNALLRKLQNAHEESKAITKAAAMKEIKKQMEKDVDEVGTIAHSIKSRFEELDRETIDKSEDVDKDRRALKNKFKDKMSEFQVMYNQLTSWMVYGILYDQYGEFFVSRQEDRDSEHDSAADTLEKLARMSTNDLSLTDWHLGFHISLDMLSEYVPMHVTESIQFAGKAIKVLRNPSPAVQLQGAPSHQHIQRGSQRRLAEEIYGGSSSISEKTLLVKRKKTKTIERAIKKHTNKELGRLGGGQGDGSVKGGDGGGGRGAVTAGVVWWEGGEGERGGVGLVVEER
ncbi:gamma-tubulin complex component 4 [Phtheirospermum japonicum]|uniref:Gamma-tubulin complex component n=1 Tax=Phtheirospermum japonicum TaxID=374723 RepID=A0A830CUY6_9LAMI|nr:gamma-tubulin complex component 4 [Phtheirospermum japonicum]